MNKDEITILEKKIRKTNKLINDFKEQNNINELLLKECLNDLLGQFEVVLKSIVFKEKDKNIFLAIMYANNVKKHSTSIYDYSIKTLALYPSDDLYPLDDLFPSDFGIWWNKLPLDRKKDREKYNCYNEYLLNQDLKQTINKIYEIIKSNYIRR